jgi:hypothetical protein
MTEETTMIGTGKGEGSKVTQFKPGKAKTGGRQQGVQNRTAQEVKEQAQQYASEAIETLVQIMRDDAVPPQTRVNAINALLDRAMGKPRQELEHSGDAAQPLEIFIRHFNDPIPSDNSSDVPDLLN